MVTLGMLYTSVSARMHRMDQNFERDDVSEGIIPMESDEIQVWYSLEHISDSDSIKNNSGTITRIRVMMEEIKMVMGESKEMMMTISFEMDRL